MKRITFYFILICSLISTDSFAGKIEKGFEKLRSFDFFSAKEYFEKSLDDELPAAAFGLSSIFSSNKNPFYNPDSAHKYILIADSSFRTSREKDKKYYAEFGINDTAISKLSDFICADAFRRYIKPDSVDAYNHYLNYYSSCAQSTDAAILRNAAAYQSAITKNTSVALKEFLSLYPTAKEYADALTKFNEKIFEENTSENSIHAYEQFLINYPESPYIKNAQQKIYDLNTSDKTVSEYASFARTYKNSPFNSDAWRKVYSLSMSDYKEETLNKFKTQFPDYPFIDEAESDFRLQNSLFLPYESNGKWGYINEDGKVMINAIYNEAGLFSEGLAAINLKDKFGYINKGGKVIIENIFSDGDAFNNGHAIIMKDSAYGAINKSGNIIVSPSYNELSDAGNDLLIAVKNDKSGYINLSGIQVTGLDFDVAGEFENGFAVVSKDEKSGLTDHNGILKIPLQYDDLVSAGDGLYKGMNEDDLRGIIDTTGRIVIPFIYDAIGDFNNGLALVAKNDKCGYINKNGSILIPLKYIYSSTLLTTAQFKNGYAVLKQKIKSILFDSTGTVISFPGFDNYGIPSQQLIPVRKNMKWGYSDLSGKIKIAAKFDDAGEFKNGYARINKKNLSGLIDTAGNVIIEPIYEDISVNEKSIMVRNNGEWGLLTRGGLLLVPCIYQKIEFIYPSVAKASGTSGFTYVNLDSGKIIYSSSVQ